MTAAAALGHVVVLAGGLSHEREVSLHSGRRVADALAEVVAQTAITAHKALGLRHLSRADLLVDDEGAVWFLECNVAPGMTDTSLLPIAVDAAGLDLGEVCRDLVVAATGARVGALT